MYFYIFFFFIHTSMANYYQVVYPSSQTKDSNYQYIQVTPNEATGYATNQVNQQNNQISNAGFLINQNTPVYTAIPNPIYYNSLSYLLHSEVMQSIPSVYNSGTKYMNSGSNVNTVYPEILILVDNSLFSQFGNNIQRTVKYVSSFWKQVDVRFGQLNTPNILLNIAGIVIFQENLPFSSYGYVYNSVLDKFGKFLLTQNKFKFQVDYDIAVLMLGNNIMYNGYSSDVGGVAYIGGACKQESNMIYSAAIIKDNGAYSGVISATHELAHTLGATHDGDSNQLGPGFLGAIECPAVYGYIMSPISLGKNQFTFSSCSQRSISYFLNQDTAYCLRNYPVAKNLNLQYSIVGK
ncbi:venom metalloproteinase 3-like [Leptopilina boulardi]|uniref:venom metalloproteinase 3-like n=1 Tax=Leptopilina boulardi TaxID=63433 RepID=UPI0021F5E423|nr:venom metalloproteinase 3-like [Leptopilina boulardi]